MTPVSGAIQQALAELEGEGVCVWPKRVTAEVVATLQRELEPLWPAGHHQGGVRDLLARGEEVRELARSSPVREAVESVLGPTAFAVRGLLFDKTPRTNWKVIWHQDLTIAVAERQDVDGYGPWSTKAGVPHVQVPVGLLERMVAVRIHLDPCGTNDGPLRVLPGSHRLGRLRGEQIALLRTQTPARVCAVESSGILLMRPLALHASSPLSSPNRRRVVHIEMAAEPLPLPLRWRDQV